jgi:glycosyltransferase involved in cell wall biosynthesis
VPYRVVLYCPDRHLTYDGRTPDDVGVGGGVTARVRMARALARQGHAMVQVVNCPRREVIDGVEYRPLDDVGKMEADVAIFNTSGGALDLTPVLGLDLTARLRVVWIHGTQVPQGLGRLPNDALYAVSNFVAQRAIEAWGIRANRVFVTYNGYESVLFEKAEAARPVRDPYQLIYFSHPSKGLDTARAVLGVLRRADGRWHLEVVGGERLWGGVEPAWVPSDGVNYHGLVGQARLATMLLQSTYSIQMQDREEPFGLSVVEAMRAGVVVVASPVGALAELITDGTSGILVLGDHLAAETRVAAAQRIADLHENGEARAHISGMARAWALDTDTLACAWSHDWMARLGEAEPSLSQCLDCGGTAWRLADGDHCAACGRFTRVVAKQAVS